MVIRSFVRVYLQKHKEPHSVTSRKESAEAVTLSFHSPQEKQPKKLIDLLIDFTMSRCNHEPQSPDNNSKTTSTNTQIQQTQRKKRKSMSNTLKGT